MANKYTGETSVKIQNKTYRLVYDWEALAEVKSIYGGDDIITRLNTGEDPKLLARVLAVGLKKFHPEITVEKILTISPPIFYIVKSIDDAFTLAYFGADGYKEVGEVKKKNFLNRLMPLRKRSN